MLTRFLSKRLNSYSEAAYLDAEEGIALLKDIQKDEEIEAYKASLQIWATLKAAGATESEAPTPPGTEQDEWVSASELMKTEGKEYQPKQINLDMELGLDLKELLYKKDD